MTFRCGHWQDQRLKRLKVATAPIRNPFRRSNLRRSGQDGWRQKRETAGEIGGTIVTFCGPGHLKLWEEQAIAAAE